MEDVKKQIAGEITLAKSPGASMKKWREIFGITQTELADHLKITPSTISDYESNRRKSPGINIIKRFIGALVEIDSIKGGGVANRMESKESPEIFEVHEFPSPVKAQALIDEIGGRIVTNKRKIKELSIGGFTVVDSLRAILELPVDEFPRIYGPNTNRMIIFTRVGIGRSPMVAIRVTKLKPSVVVFHGLKEMDDPIALKISEVEKIPVVLTDSDVEGIKRKFEKYC